MQAVAIFRHSVRQIIGNAGAVVRLTLFLSVVPLLLFLGLGVQPYLDGSTSLPPDQWPWGRLVPALAASLVASLWLAVGWHRFVLLEETAPGLTPRWNGARILSYLGASIIAGLLVVLAGLVIGFAGGLVLSVLAAAALPTSAVAIVLFTLLGALLILAPLLTVFFRLGAIMPAAAVGEPLKVSGAWAATAGASGAFYMLALMLVALSVVLDLLGGILPTGSVPAAVWFFVAQWINLILGLSILTTIYGHYVQRRPLVGA